MYQMFLGHFIHHHHPPKKKTTYTVESHHFQPINQKMSQLISKDIEKLFHAVFRGMQY